MAREWELMVIERMAERFAGTGIARWVAGGCAIDLFHGWETRRHDDLDIEIFRSDVGYLFDIFDGWDIHIVSESGAEPWSDPTTLEATVFGAWLRSDRTEPWHAEIVFARGHNKGWRYRRDSSIVLPGSELIRWTESGIPYDVPETQLLYKSIQQLPKDDGDLARCSHG
jgi:hypothetical protein